jgi:hypothetical protein
MRPFNVKNAFKILNLISITILSEIGIEDNLININEAIFIKLSQLTWRHVVLLNYCKKHPIYPLLHSRSVF